MKFCIWACFEFCRENSVFIKSGKNNGTVHADRCTFFMTSVRIFDDICQNIWWRARIFDDICQNFLWHVGIFYDMSEYLMTSVRIFLRMRNVAGNNFTENQNTHFIFNNIFYRKSFRLWDNVEKYGRAAQATDDSMAHAHCVLDNQGYKHTHTQYVILFTFPQQQR